MFAWAIGFAIVALAAGIAGFGGFAGGRGELALTLFTFALIASAVFAIVGVRRELRKRRTQESPPTSR
jgi:uncharacterized membrane protein YtjA (UPF0391 family)